MPKTKTTSYPCEEEGCDKTFTRSSDRKRHVDTIHKKIHKFTCTVLGCGSTFTQQSGLTVHLKAKHSPVRHFHCRVPGCEDNPVGFGDGSARLRHEFEQHAPAGFVCPELHCGEAFKRQKYLKAHADDLHPGKWKTYAKDQTKNTWTAKRFDKEILEPLLKKAKKEGTLDNVRDDDESDLTDMSSDPEDEPPMRRPKHSSTWRTSHRIMSEDDVPAPAPAYLKDVSPALARATPLELPPAELPMLPEIDLSAPAPDAIDWASLGFEVSAPAPELPDMLPGGVPAGLGSPVYNMPRLLDPSAVLEANPNLYGPLYGARPNPAPMTYAPMPMPMSQPYSFAPMMPMLPNQYSAFGGNALGLGMTMPPASSSGFSYDQGSIYFDPRMQQQQFHSFINPQAPAAPPPTPTPTAGPSTSATPTTMFNTPTTFWNGSPAGRDIQAMERQRLQKALRGTTDPWMGGSRTF